jgi:gliding motility-associated-like protein
MIRILIKCLALLKRVGISLLLLLLMLYPSATHATHIVGAELYYECLNPNSNTYSIRLRMLRDCQNGEAPFDDVVSLFIFPSNNPSNYRIVDINKPPVTPRLVNVGWSQCVSNSAQPCVEEGIYQTIVTMQPVTGGYDIGWARCCRNGNIDNLNQPLNQGVTFLAHVPGPEDAICNSMAVFNNTLPTFICANEDFYFDHRATDGDGDSLVYALTWPFDGINLQGLGAGNPSLPGIPQPVVDFSNPMGPPPYRNVAYNGGFTFPSPFGVPPTASIDPQTGLLHFNAPNLGVFVVAISVFEYRNGVLIAENKKDLQLHVLQCFPQNQPPTITHTFSPGDSVLGDTIVIVAKDTTCYHITITDPDSTHLAVQPISTIFSGPDAPSVSISGLNPLEVDICWDSRCDFAGSNIELILMGYDLSNCPIYNPAFDTVYIKIIPPPDVTPVLTHVLPPNNPLGPDTLRVEVDSIGCFVIWIADSSRESGPILSSYSVTPLGSGALNFTMTPDLSHPDSVGLRFCVTGGCDNRDQLYRIDVTGELAGACPPNNFNFDQVFVYVAPVPNPPPVVTPNILGNVLSGDTILIDVHDTVCFSVVVNDTFPGYGLHFEATLEAVDGGPNGGFPLQVSVLDSVDSLSIQVCWYTVCDNVDRLFRIILEGEQDNQCDASASAYATVFVRVRAVINPPPVLSHTIDTNAFLVHGDTIVIAADSAACFNFELSDFGDNVFLELLAEVQALPSYSATGHGIQISYTEQSDTLLAGSICFTPGCAFWDQTLAVPMIGRDTFDCYPSNWVHDTVFIRVTMPVNQPPVLTHDLSGLQFSGDLVTAVPNGSPYCYHVYVNDPDSLYADLTAEGVGRIFEDWNRYGNPPSVTVSGTNPLDVAVCWDPSCYESGETFTLRICARDTSRCALTPTVCDSVRFVIEGCSLEIGNVFSPNGDGINDEFVPYNVIGVDFYSLKVFDRWGRQVYAGENHGWNGGLNGESDRQVPDGVYYFILTYQFYSARGIPLKTEEMGPVTLLR